MLRIGTRKTEHTAGQGADGAGVQEARRIASSEAIDEVAKLLESAALEHENTPPHRLYYAARVVANADGYGSHDELTPATLGEADLVGSKTLSGAHAPTIDLDVPCRLIPSTTEGHFHLYIDVEMTKKNYSKLLKTLVEVGLVEEGFGQMLDKKDATFVRVPGKPKLLPGEDTRRTRKSNPGLRY